ncbi:hypothetical protein BD289DRAFT_165648 [Coniella lustricola]|uniref:Uncharacterized protein n=1 Tax=Coniella lustricola TaxID=2025994 RepID=A0A2T2ZU67_9PEZI|nr:hypothetical protein BD289DRAFT_165648 [Coniella lustricola]
MGDQLRHAFGSRTHPTQPSRPPPTIPPPPPSLAPPLLTTTTPTARDRRVNATAPRNQRNTNHSLQRAHTETQMGQMLSKMPRFARWPSFFGFGSTTQDQSSTKPTLPELRKNNSDPTVHNSWDVSPGSARPGHAAALAAPNYYNPNLHQMMDIVSSAIMANGTSEPIPRHLNGFIAGMIEEFRICLSKYDTLQKDHSELEIARQKEAKEHATTAQKWKARKNAYKEEIKGLKRMIVEGRNDVESAMPTPADSVSDREDAKAFTNALDSPRITGCEFPTSRVVNLHGTHQQAKTDGAMHDIDDQKIAVPVLDIVAAEHSSVVSMEEQLPRVLVNHNSDVAKSEQLRSLDSTATHTKRIQFEQKVHPRVNVAAQKVITAGANLSASEKPKPRNSDSSATTAYSVTAASTPSASLITQGLLAQRVAQEPITPHTTPPGPVPDARQGRGFAEILELVKMNGGLPEQVVEEEEDDDDDDIYGSSFVPPHPTRKLSFKKQDLTTNASQDTNDISQTIDSNIQNNGPNTSSGDPVGHRQSAYSRVPSSSMGLQRASSALLSSMGRNLVEERRKSTEQLGQRGSMSSRNTSSSRGSSGSLLGTPTRKAQSGQDPFPDEATKYAYRHARLVTNTHIRANSLLTKEDSAELARMEARYPGVGYPPPAAAQRRARVAPRPVYQRSTLYRASTMPIDPQRAAGNHIQPPSGLEQVVAARRQVVRLAPGFGDVVEEQPIEVCEQASAAAPAVLETSNEDGSQAMGDDDNEVPKEFLCESEALHD